MCHCRLAKMMDTIEYKLPLYARFHNLAGPSLSKRLKLKE